ncbi:MAG TPA: diguanylate cyclase, partial [Gaiellales bacterium]|nr:diguanylate cyclase [Gaiellales bacterium]
MGQRDIPGGLQGADRPAADERRLAVQYAAVNALARADSVGAGAGDLLRTLCDVTGWHAALLWLVAPSGAALERAGQWRSPAVESRAWLRLGRASSLVRGGGVVGRVWTTGEPVWAEHVSEPRYGDPRRRDAIASAVAVPAVHDGSVCGVLELVSIWERTAEPALLRGLVDAGIHVGRQLAFDRARQSGLRSEARMAAILDSALDGVVVMDAEGTVLEFNLAAEQAFGHHRADAVGRSLAELIIPPGLRSAHGRGLLRISSGRGGRLLGRRVETTALRADGSEFPVELTITRVDLPGPPMFAGTIRDLSERQRAERELRLRERALAATGDGVLIADATRPGTPIVYVNPAFERITGHAAANVTGRSPRLLEGPDTDPETRDLLERAVAAGRECSVTVLHYRSDGSTFWDDVSVSPVHDEVGRLVSWVATHRDVSDRLEAERQISHLAYHDAMTGLPNRVMFQEHLDLAIARARRSGLSAAVMFLDLDDFKLVNDSLGHAAGDRLLIEVGKRLRTITRDTDLVARQGGDEFLVLVPDLTGPEGGADSPEAVCDTVADKIRAAVELPIALGGQEVSVGVSLGAAIFPDAADTRDELLRQADLAMYRAKVLRRGGSPHVYAHELVDSRSHVSAAARLRRAAERGEFVLHYQPIV